jgi:type 1 glutamine amidotransferase
MTALRMAPLIVALLAGVAAAAEEKADAKVRVLIIDGQNNHNWRATTPYLKKALEDCGRFEVAVSSFLKKDDKPGEIKETVPFPPDLGKYDVVLSNYNGQPWPEEFQRALDAAVKDGKLGLVVFHAADNAFSPWPEYNRMIGLGWRNNKFGDRLYLDADGKLVRQAKGEGLGAGETVGHAFPVLVRDVEHPITRGMPREWMHTADQLVHGLRGPGENLHVLATAYSSKDRKGTGENELMMWTVNYGKGRVFHTPMGHDLTALRCVGLTTVLRRGVEWAATGNVTLPIPKEFPTAEKASAYGAK